MFHLLSIKIMKYNKLYIITLFLILGAFIVACDDYEDVEEPSPVVGNDVAGLAFSSDNATSFELDPSEDPVLELKVIRKNDNGSLEAPVTVVDNTENSFVVPSSIVFADGEKSALLDVPIKADAPTDTSLTLELEFDDQYVDPYSSSYPYYKGKVDLKKWVKYATGTFISDFFEQDWEQDLYQLEDENLFRFPDLYFEGYNLEFEWVSSDSTLAIVPAQQATGYDHPDYGMVYVQPGDEDELTFYDPEEGTFQFNLKWVVEAGSFGDFPEVFTVTELVE